VPDLAARVAELFPGVRADLEALVRIPSVSAEGDTPAMRACLDHVDSLFATLGLRTRRLEVDGGPPALLAERDAAPGAPTVLLYSHYDVQPAGPASDWPNGQPFEPQEQRGRLYGRGASDDKSGIAIHLGALRALAADCRVGVQVLLEGEEELGSPHMAAMLERFGHELHPDLIVIADSEHWRVGEPAVTTTQRGLADAIVEVRTLRDGVHSGQFGGAVPDALTVLVRLLATLHDAAGNVAIEGLVTAPAPTVEVPEAELRETGGVLDGVSLIGSGALAERLWARPAVSVLAIDAPRVSEAINQLIPVARAKVSLRLAPGEVPERARAALVRHLEQHVEWGAQVTVTPGAAAPAFVASGRGPYFEAIVEGMREAWGVEANEIGIGGTIPLVSMLADLFPRAEVVVTGVGDPTSHIHGPDESQDLEELRRSILAEALALQRLGGQ